MNARDWNYQPITAHTMSLIIRTLYIMAFAIGVLTLLSVLFFLQMQLVSKAISKPCNCTITYLYRVGDNASSTIEIAGPLVKPAPKEKKVIKKPAKKAKTFTATNKVAASMKKPTPGKTLTKSGGVFYFNGRKECWYSQRVLPGGGLKIPGRHVGQYGLIKDGKGYIVVAASDLSKGTVLLTSLGLAKVYDTGCAKGITDVYTNW